MGIISYFKNLHYENKFNKAGQLLDEGKATEAEEIYLSIVDKHPQAACKLAELYMSLASQASVNEDIDLFKKTVSLKSKSLGCVDTSSFDDILSRFVRHISVRADSCFESGNFGDCFSLASALYDSNTSSKEVNVLCSEAKIRLIFQDILTTKVYDKVFNSLLDAFRQEWTLCNDKPRAKQSSLMFCEELIEARRYYTANALLGIILDAPFSEKCLDNAVQIIKGHDIEASGSIVSAVVSSYGKRVVLRKDVPEEESISLFDSCWRSSLDETVIMDLLQSTKSSSLRNGFIEKILQNESSYLSSNKLFKKFTAWINSSLAASESLVLFEKLHKLGYDVQDYYVKKVHSIITDKQYNEAMPILLHAQDLFFHSEIIIDDILSFAQSFLDNNDNEKALSTADCILLQNEKSSAIKAQALCNLAGLESNTGKRMELLSNAQTVLSPFSGAESSEVNDAIIEEIIHTTELIFKEGDREKAFTILGDLARKGSEKSAFTIAGLRLTEVKAIRSLDNRINTADNAIKELNGLGFSTIYFNQEYQQLWDEKINAIISKSQKIDNRKAILQFEALIKEIENAHLPSSTSNEKKATVVKQVVKRKYLVARDSELAGNLTDAAFLYKEINVLEAKKTPTLSALRFILCKLKSPNGGDVLAHRDKIYSLLRDAADVFKSEREDIAYRFALILLKAGEDQEALSVLEEFLPGEEKLKKACEQGAIIKALAKLDDFNSKLEAVKNKTLSSDEAVYFINHMLEYAETIKPALELPRSILSGYRNKLKNYAIFKLFDEARYDIAFEKMIKEHKDYLDDYTALRNIALICLNMAETKQISMANYQEVIAVWLTAIYQEKLFIKSLDYTSWDDQFTFSLYEAYGHFDEDSVGDLPDNINFSNSNDSNVVLIKEVQRALLDRFEAAISDTQRYHDFFTSQKDTMDRFISLNLDEKCRIVAPYLAHKDEGVFQDISDALEQDREQQYDNWEDVLAVGALYQMPQFIYSDYSKAKLYYEDCIAAIDNVSTNRAKLAFTPSKVDLVRRFDKLSSALISYCNSKLSSLSAKNKADFKNNYTFYLIICQALNDRTLSFIFANFVMQYVVGEVNDNTLKKTDAADFILSVFLLDKTNTRVKENLSTLFEMLAREDSADSDNAVISILKKIERIDPTLYNNLNRKYEQAQIDKKLQSIVARVNRNAMKQSDALILVYDLYSKHLNNSSICNNLAQLCELCIDQDIIGMSPNRSSVRRILDRLLINRSPVFMRYTSRLRKKYDSIWSQIPSNHKALLAEDDSELDIAGKVARLTMMNMGQSLTEKGEALKEALHYFKRLSE